MPKFLMKNCPRCERSSSWQFQLAHYLCPSEAAWYMFRLYPAKVMAVSIVGCRLDYSNSILYDISQANIYKLQRVQTILARIVVGAPWTSSSLNICRDLHWLPVGRRITYKLRLTAWKTLHTSQPLYLSELISRYLPSRSLHSSNTNLLPRPACITSNFTFFCACTSTWNSLPAHVRSIDALSTFKRHLKFYLFQSAFSV